MSDYPREYTASERLERARLLFKGSRQIVRGGHEHAVDGRVERRIDRIDQRAEERWARGAQVAHQAVDSARTELARAEHALRMAKGPDKGAARQAVNDAKDKARRADAAARKYR
jgi:hypothetical protein